jgi:hypothetical protein
MSERQNTIVCIFDMKSPRISAFNVHEWVFETLRLAEDDLQMIQADGPKRNVYIKFKSADKQHKALQDMKEQHEYEHEKVEISQVTIEPAGMEMRTVRIAKLPPEVNNRTITNTLTQY